MKRIWKTLICSLLIVAMLASTAPAFAASSIARIMKVNTDYARMRSSADSSGSVIASLRKGTKLLYWGAHDGAMCKVMTSSGITGYVYGAYLSTYGAMNMDSVYVTNAATPMYVRSGYSLKPSGYLARGRYVMVYKAYNGWAFIKTMSGAGAFVKVDTLSKVF